MRRHPARSPRSLGFFVWGCLHGATLHAASMGRSRDLAKTSPRDRGSGASGTTSGAFPARADRPPIGRGGRPNRRGARPSPPAPHRRSARDPRGSMADRILLAAMGRAADALPAGLRRLDRVGKPAQGVVGIGQAGEDPSSAAPGCGDHGKTSKAMNCRETNRFWRTMLAHGPAPCGRSRLAPSLSGIEVARRAARLDDAW